MGSNIATLLVMCLEEELFIFLSIGIYKFFFAVYYKYYKELRGCK